jgi:hypothetical protein
MDNPNTPKETEKPSEVQNQQETKVTPTSASDLTNKAHEIGSKAVDKAAEDIFMARLGANAENFKKFLIKLGEKGVTKLRFEENAVSYWHQGNEYRIPANFIKHFEVKNPNDKEEVKKQFVQLGEEGVTKLHFDENGISFLYQNKKYNIPTDLMR